MEDLEDRIERFSNLLSHYTREERDTILSAARWGANLHRNQKRASGEPYFIHPMAVAEILIHLRLDYQAIIAALLHDVLEDTEVRHEELRQRFGREVESLVNGVTKISVFRAAGKAMQGAETIRKMLFAMVKDIRVILIKLADKLHNMQTLEYLDRSRGRKIAAECLDIYAPLAGRLGISWVKDELEDLALKCLHPDAYLQINRYISERRDVRASHLDSVKMEISREAALEGVDVDIKTRAKRFYSIYQKMKNQAKGMDEIYDLLGIRILCDTTVECYTLLGLVHRLWKPLAGRFKDYIAMPKANRYQSLHTTVMGQDGKLIEIQIRTREMNQTAEYGVAAHWLYKHRGVTARPDELTIINKLRSWNNGILSSADFLDEIKNELLKDSIYVFTPKGDVIELPTGATPIDFAYYIHTEVGNRCQGAKVDGKIYSLKKPLKNTQVVAILTSSRARPHLNWLRFAGTHRARSKIRQWLNKHDESLIIDRNIVVRKGEGEFPAARMGKPKKKSGSMQVLDQSRVGIRIGKERDIMIRMARCCNPAIGDRIVGYVSRGRGIIVHREDCSSLAYIKDFEERHIEVEWETISPKTLCRFRITAREAADVFSEIEGAIKKYQGHLVAGKLYPNQKGTLTGYFTIEIDRVEQFNKVIKNLRTVPSIINIQPARNVS
jgi:GTP pyrophosphokinase